MTEAEINRYIHEQIMGKCWHDGGGLYTVQKCNKCSVKRLVTSQDNPQYTSDSSPRSLLRDVVAKLVEQGSRPSDKLCDALELALDDGHYVALPAEAIARSCVNAHKASKGGSDDFKK